MWHFLSLTHTHVYLCISLMLINFKPGRIILINDATSRSLFLATRIIIIFFIFVEFFQYTHKKACNDYNLGSMSTNYGHTHTLKQKKTNYVLSFNSRQTRLNINLLNIYQSHNKDPFNNMVRWRWVPPCFQLPMQVTRTWRCLHINKWSLWFDDGVQSFNHKHLVLLTC